MIVNKNNIGVTFIKLLMELFFKKVKNIKVENKNNPVPVIVGDNKKRKNDITNHRYLFCLGLKI